MTVATSDLFVDAGIVRETREVVLYGAGGIGRDVFRVLTAKGIRVSCILDRNASDGQTHGGVPVARPEACPVIPGARASIPVVVSIFNRDADVPAIAHALRSQGFRHIVSFVGLHAAFPASFGDRFWLTDTSYLDAHAKDLARAEGIWADEQSAALYRSVLAFRRTGRYDDRLRPRGKQYLPADIPGWLGEGPLRFVDCGAYRGDTLDDILDSGLPLEASAHFEPDIENFGALVRHVRERLALAGSTAVCWPCAVGHRSAIVRFQDGRDEASRVADGGDSSIPAVALDDVLIGFRPTFIKMDIEGAEIDALEGARTLMASRPSLAVCVYHRPDHLWRIPLLLSERPDLNGYRFYLRSHGYNGFDTVLYASPRREVRS